MEAETSNGDSHFAEERIEYERDADRPNRFVPQIFIMKKSGVTSNRKFEATDMARVLEFEEVSGGKAPTFRDGSVMVGDFQGDGTTGITFPVFHIALRGGYIFCFNERDVEPGRNGSYTTYEAAPVCIIPLDHVDVQFPPGGRRVFREHAQTAAQSGYELIVQHAPPSEDDAVRPPAFLVADSLSKRNKLGEAIKARAKLVKPTVLRAGYSAAVAAAGAASEDPMSQAHRKDLKMEKDAKKNDTNNQTRGKQQDRNGTSRRKGEEKSMETKILEVSEDADMAAAVVEYGIVGFDEKDWANNYFQTNTHAEAVANCEKMEKWLTNMKKSLKGAVLEQYEYFVQASGEMTTMGKEVSSLKSRIESQVDTLREMKDIDFFGATREDDLTEGDEIMGREDDGSASLDSEKDDNIFGEDFGALMNRHRGRDYMNGHNGKIDQSVNDKDAPPEINVPEWLDDADEEILATMRECRYSSAIDQYLKAETEIVELLEKHEGPTPYELSPTNLDKLRSLKKRLKSIGNKISSHLEESLRRKNEALRQANKRERADAAASLAPVVSPCALNDDGHYLQMLVKLGRTKEAAEAFTARRSLLLLECLQERPMSGAGTVDLVIYAAQLSQSFFSCLASSVEAFLDLFIVAPHDKAEDSDASSLQSQSMVGNKTLPAGAVSSLVLWCDAELSKFAIAFGGTRILANLSLSPPSTNSSAMPRVVGETKDRENAIAVAAQCIDQGFLYAAQNLDGVGLPLSPRLAEMIRVRLKGCEAEIAERLNERWHTLTQDWRQQHY